MSYQYSYALEKFSRAICHLATGEDEIRKRLFLIFQDDLIMITKEKLPPHLHEDYEWVKNQITRYTEKYSGCSNFFESSDGRYDHLIPTKIEATLHRIKRSTGKKIAMRLFHIWSVLDEESRVQL